MLPLDPSFERRLRIAGRVLIAVALYVLIMSGVEFALHLTPWQPGSVQWRFGIVGALGPGLTAPLLAFALAYAGGTLTGSRRVLTVLAASAGLAVVALGATVIFFLLDAVQMRALAPSGDRRLVEVAIGKTLLTYLSAILVGGALARWSLAMRRGLAPEGAQAGVAW